MAHVRRVLLPFVVIPLSLFPQIYRAKAPANATFIVALPDNQQANLQGAVETGSGEEQTPAVPKPSSLLQLLERRKDGLFLWAGIAVTSFIIGWICGGNFYLRRERKRSRKLRF
jgi:hypothetical protein